MDKCFNAREEIEIILSKLTIVERIKLLESISKKYRRENSKRINERQMGRVFIDERPDEINLKP